jgi:hypothetical protein
LQNKLEGVVHGKSFRAGLIIAGKARYLIWRGDPINLIFNRSVARTIDLYAFSDYLIMH